MRLHEIAELQIKSNFKIFFRLPTWEENTYCYFDRIGLVSYTLDDNEEIRFVTLLDLIDDCWEVKEYENKIKRCGLCNNYPNLILYKSKLKAIECYHNCECSIELKTHWDEIDLIDYWNNLSALNIKYKERDLENDKTNN